MRVGKWAALPVIAGCGTNAPTQEHRDPPARPDRFKHRRCYATPAEDVANWEPKDFTVSDKAWRVGRPLDTIHTAGCATSLSTTA